MLEVIAAIISLVFFIAFTIFMCAVAIITAGFALLIWALTQANRKEGGKDDCISH